MNVNIRKPKQEFYLIDLFIIHLSCGVDVLFLPSFHFVGGIPKTSREFCEFYIRRQNSMLLEERRNYVGLTLKSFVVF